MPNTRLYVQGQDYQLAGSGCTSSAISIDLTSFTLPNGTLITMADFGTLGYITFEPETVREENASFTGVTQNGNGTATLTGVTRGLNFVSPYTASAPLQIAHAGGTTVRITNNAPFYNDFANKENNETINQVWTFATAATPLITDAPVSGTQAANKDYVDGVAIAGAPDASTSTKGITKLNVAPASATNPIAIGANDPAIAGNGGTPGAANTYVTQQGFQEGSETYAASSVGTDAYAITTSPNITALTDGMIVRFKADVANTGAATLALGTTAAKAIVTGVSTALNSNAILAGTIAVVVYSLANDNYQLQTPDANMATAISASILDAKGDIIAATAADTASRLAVGTVNNMSLVVDSAQSTGLKYAIMSQSVPSGNIFTAVTVTGTTSESTLASITIPANYLSTTNAIRMRCYVQQLGLANAANFVLRAKYAGTTYISSTYTNSTGSTVITNNGTIEFLLMSNGSTGSQQSLLYVDCFKGTVNGPGTATTDDIIRGTNVAGATSGDSTANQTMAITIQFSSSAANNDCTIKMSTVELIA